MHFLIFLSRTSGEGRKLKITKSTNYNEFYIIITIRYIFLLTTIIYN